MLDKDINDFATGIEMDLFGRAKNMQEAIKYAYNLIETLPPEFKEGAYTGLHVVLNTVAQELRTLVREEEW